MKISINLEGKNYQCDLANPIDISIPIGQVKCFYSTDFKVSPYTADEFIGSVKEGAPVNFFDVQMNPHGNGTHTECLGHITKAQESVNDHLKQFHFLASLVSVDLEELDNGDSVISLENLMIACHDNIPEAIIIRTLPNDDAKLTKDYSGTNPPYLTSEAMTFLVESGVKHLLLDLPSVDREVDDGILAAHHIFWKVQGNEADKDSRFDCTITEMIYVPNEVLDGLYLLNIQIPSMQLDAAPSKPVLYALHKV